MTWILEFIDVKISIQNFGYAFQLLITVENMSSNKFNQLHDLEPIQLVLD